MPLHPETTTPGDYLAALDSAAEGAGRPFFQVQTTSAGRWVTVHQEIPVGASPDILGRLHQAAVCCASEAAAFIDQAEAGGDVQAAIEEHWQRADWRIGEIAERFAALRLAPPEIDTTRCEDEPDTNSERDNPMTDHQDTEQQERVLQQADIAADPVASLALPLPADPTPELLEEALFAARTVTDWASSPQVQRAAETRALEISDKIDAIGGLPDSGSDLEWQDEMAEKYPAIAAWRDGRIAEVDTAQEIAPAPDGRADLDARVAELMELAGGEDSLTVEAAALRQTMLTDAINSAEGPQEAEALTRMKDAATQDFAAHLGTLAAISLEAGGQHEDGSALRLEAAARRMIAESLREGPSPSDPTPGWPETPGTEQGDRGQEAPAAEPDFRADAEAAARANGFGPTAAVVHMEAMKAEPAGTNPGIVFEENRAAVAPGGNDYSVLREPPPLAAEQAGLADAQQPEATMTRVPTIGIGPGGAVIVEINHSPGAHIAEAALEATGYAEPFRPGSEAQQEAVAAERLAATQSSLSPSATAETHTETGQGKVTERPTESAPDRFASLADYMARNKADMEAESGNAGPEQGQEAASAFRSFGR